MECLGGFDDLDSGCAHGGFQVSRRYDGAVFECDSLKQVMFGELAEIAVPAGVVDGEFELFCGQYCSAIICTSEKNPLLGSIWVA